MNKKNEKCPYCDPENTEINGSGWPMLEYYYDVVSIFNNDLQLRCYNEDKQAYGKKDAIHIKYCPMCGRKLR